MSRINDKKDIDALILKASGQDREKMTYDLSAIVEKKFCERSQPCSTHRANPNAAGARNEMNQEYSIGLHGLS
jgi:hypothetical protein